MSVTLNEVLFYGSVNMPEADGVTIGGLPDLTKRVSFFDLVAAGAFDVVSSSAADTATKIQVTGRDSTGVIRTPAAVTLTGTTLLANTFGSQSFERLLAGVVTGGAIAGLADPGGTPAVGDVACIAHTREIAGHTAQAGSANKTGVTPPLLKLQAGDGATIGGLTYGGLALVIRITGGTGINQLRMIASPYAAGAYGTDFVAVNRDWDVLPDNTSTYDIAFGMLFDILPNPVRAITRIFATAQADVAGGTSRLFYEKLFCLNVNTTVALSTASISVLSESPGLPGSAALDIALCKILNDNATSANRQTLPTNQDASALTFVAQPASVSVIAPPGSLPNGNLAANAQGVWFRLTLPAGTAPYKGAANVAANGTTI